MAKKKVSDQSSVLPTMEDIVEFRRYMNDPYDITPKGAELLERARKRAANLKL